MSSENSISISPGPRVGTIVVPRSKSHEHRLLIANFLAGDTAALPPRDGDNADILATKRCLGALATGDPTPELDCGESGSTLRFLAPIAAALGRHPKFVRRGRLAERPFRQYEKLEPGIHELAGDISSQFVTGLLFALPLLKGDSEIRFTSPLESRGYVDMTLRVIRDAGIEIGERENGFVVRGNQKYHPQSTPVEGDWSGAAFWFAMNALGSEIEVRGLVDESAQPDRAIQALCRRLPARIDVSQYPDIFPALAVVAAGTPKQTTFTGIARLRLKECDRVEAMREALQRLGVEAQVKVGGEGEEVFVVSGSPCQFAGCPIRTFDDHRIAMAAAVAATHAMGPIAIDNAACCAKSYPDFFTDFSSCRRYLV